MQIQELSEKIRVICQNVLIGLLICHAPSVGGNKLSIFLKKSYLLWKSLLFALQKSELFAKMCLSAYSTFFQKNAEFVTADRWRMAKSWLTRKMLLWMFKYPTGIKIFQYRSTRARQFCTTRQFNKRMLSKYNNPNIFFIKNTNNLLKNADFLVYCKSREFSRKYLILSANFRIFIWKILK